MSEVGDLEYWQGDGIIAAVESETEGFMLVASGLPVVDVSGGWRHPEASLVSNDNVDIGAMAGDYFLGNGFLHFACCHADGSGWSADRLRGFSRATEAKKLGELSVFSRPMSWWHSPEFSRELADFLAAQRRPLALFAANDIIGLNVVGSCRLAGLRVPEDVAIVGVDNEELLCNLSRPALSSIAFDRHEIGRRAARCLEELIASGNGKPKTIRIPPVRLVERASSAIVPVADPLIIQALSLIRREAVKGLTASDVVQALYTSRRNLERRFSRAMGCSILAKIHKTRIEYAKTLLREGDLPIVKIAVQSGFASVNRFTAAFSKYVGMPPRDYPKRSAARP
ncbi:MAG: substrate-binding domain-containing protein [Planctomycetaceae bacterium]|nr:substrate-binding domain-containing protein [Planctomycetaceae bacterium]